MSLELFNEDVLAMARTIWGEGRSESKAAKIAMGWVIRNRAVAKTQTIFDACKEFDCWADDTRQRMESLSDGELAPLKAIAKDVIFGKHEDPTCGATRYHPIMRTSHTQTWPPAWTEGYVGTTIGRNIFYAVPINGADRRDQPNLDGMIIKVQVDF